MSKPFSTLRSPGPKRGLANRDEDDDVSIPENGSETMAGTERTTPPRALEDLDVDAFGVTDVGRKRKVNEDQYLIAELSKSMLVQRTSLPLSDDQRLLGGARGKLFIVADGMGGHGGGSVASTVAVDAIVRHVLNIMPWFFGLDESQEDDLMDELKAALRRCQRSVQRAAKGGSGDSRMGTTMTAAYVLWPRLYVVHAGDSRCYLVRDSTPEQITRDHTVAQRLVDQESLPPEEASKTKWSSVLWNAIGGGDESLTPEVYRGDLERGDTLLLCTDGLTGHLDDGAIGRELGKHASSAEAAARALVEQANARGGRDNVTAVVARFH